MSVITSQKQILKLLYESLMFCFQELLVMLFLIIVVTPLPQRIRIMTAAVETVLCGLKEPGGTSTVITPT